MDNDRRRQQEMMMRMGMGRDGPMGRDGQMGGQMGMRDGGGPGGQGMQGPNREEMMLRGQVRGYYCKIRIEESLIFRLADQALRL